MGLKAALLWWRFCRLLARAASSSVDRAERVVIARAKVKFGGVCPGMSCNCGDCWLYWLQNK